MDLYRYDFARSEYSYIYLSTFFVHRETPKGYFIYASSRKDGGKFILASGHKRYAYPTIELAWNSFQIRTHHRLQHLASEHGNVAACHNFIKDAPPPDKEILYLDGTTATTKLWEIFK